MITGDYKNERPLEALLWDDNWGVRRSDLTSEDAGIRGLVLLRGRWVPESEKSKIDDLLTAADAIRRSSISWTVLILIFWAIVASYLIPYSTRGISPEQFSAVLAVFSIQIVAGVALRSYKNWAWLFVISNLAGMGAWLIWLQVTVIFAVRSFSKDLPFLIFRFCIPLALCLYTIARLLKPQVREIFRKDRRAIIRDSRPKRKFGSVSTIIGVGSLLFLNIGLDFYYYDGYKSAGIPMCDRIAAADVGRLVVAIERLQNEVVDLNCPPDIHALLKNGFELDYLVGPYYGWSGTTQKCEILVRLEGGEVCGCSLKGSRHGPDREYRYVYRTSIAEGRDRSPTIGPCTGKSYGTPEDSCFTVTMLGSDCSIRRPTECTKCKDLKKVE